MEKIVFEAYGLKCDGRLVCLAPDGYIYPMKDHLPNNALIYLSRHKSYINDICKKDERFKRVKFRVTIEEIEDTTK